MSWRRFIVAVVCGAAATMVVFYTVGPVVGSLMARLMPPAVETWSDRMAVLFATWGSLGLLMLPGIAVGVLLATGRLGGIETRCRKCNYILRGISEPRCPECGERI